MCTYYIHRGLPCQAHFCPFHPVCLQLQMPGSASSFMFDASYGEVFLCSHGSPRSHPRTPKRLVKPVFWIWFGTSFCLLDGSYRPRIVPDITWNLVPCCNEHVSGREGVMVFGYQRDGQKCQYICYWFLIFYL